MIRVALNGGLGNQLFQYAAAKTLAVKHNTSLGLDVIPLYSKLQVSSLATYRKLELDVFCIEAQRNEMLFRNKYLYPLSKTHFFLNRLYNSWKFTYFKEKDFSFDSSVLELPDNTYLDGHFQSEKYFKPIEEIIRNECRFKQPLYGKNREWESIIANNASVSVHIRRGDYVSLQKNLQKHGATSLEYYQKAVGLMAAKIHQPLFFIFTDDVPWVRAHFKLDFPFHIIDNNTTAESSHLDMQLISLCRHHIICNSTFSWWGAWLNNKADKIVMAPEKWFADPSINSKDIYPSDWIKL